MKIAIYSRKSRATEQGESIQNQIDMCKSYAKAHFPDKNIEFFTYTDDGFSGGNIDRPQFQLLLKQLKKGTYDVLMCYRLDRISRNVSDFSSTLDILTKKDTGFVSIKENFDTTTPMGRAMIHIASVFAQLERETIAERIKDNMHALARTGRWLGGITPTGYCGKKEVYYNGKNEKKHAVKLTPVKEEQEIVKLIFDKYIELGSMNKVETYCIQNDIKTRNGKLMIVHAISDILKNPVYCIADDLSYKYFAKVGADIAFEEHEFDGEHGLMAYNKTDQTDGSPKAKDVQEWVIAIGKHKGIIESEKWVKVQTKIGKNRSWGRRGRTPSSALLSSLIFCDSCKDRMLVVNHELLVDGTYAYYYRCRTKNISKGTKCKMDNVAGHRLDRYVVAKLKETLGSRTGLDILLENEKQNILTQKNSLVKDKNRIERNIAKNEKDIDGLVMKLVDVKNNDNVTKYVTRKIDELHEENEKLKQDLLEIKSDSTAFQIKELNWDMASYSLTNFNTLIEERDAAGKRELIKDVVSEVVWDGEHFHIKVITDKLDPDLVANSNPKYHRDSISDSHIISF